uniref:Uncharacterized protein n=1 Tax=viral metagenome TaxID=1070528 RepID=A0A6C0F994_9ZZZZ
MDDFLLKELILLQIMHFDRVRSYCINCALWWSRIFRFLRF